MDINPLSRFGFHKLPIDEQLGCWLRKCEMMKSDESDLYVRIHHLDQNSSLQQKWSILSITYLLWWRKFMMIRSLISSQWSLQHTQVQGGSEEKYEKKIIFPFLIGIGRYSCSDDWIVLYEVETLLPIGLDVYVWFLTRISFKFVDSNFLSREKWTLKIA